MQNNENIEQNIKNLVDKWKDANRKFKKEEQANVY